MATPAVIGFHNATGIEERNKVRLRIQQGTKASSPQIRSYRRQHLDIYQPHATLPDNSTGSKNRPFYASKDESHYSLEDKVKMRGGVLSTKEGQKYAKFILNRRGNDIRAKELVSQGIEPSSVMPTGDLVLTPDESKSLELNNLLQGVSDAIEASDFSGLTINDLKNIPRLMINTLPKMTQQNFAELNEFIREMTEELDAIINPKSDRADDEVELQLDTKSTSGARRIKEYLDRILLLLRNFAKVMGRDEASKVATLRALVSEFFSIRPSDSSVVVPSEGQMRVVDRRAFQPIAPGEKRALPRPAKRKALRRKTPSRAPSPPPRAPSPPPRVVPPAEEERREAEDDEKEASAVVSAPDVRSPALTPEQRQIQADLFQAHFDAGIKSDPARREEGLDFLRNTARRLSLKVDNKMSRTVLKGKINSSKNAQRLKIRVPEKL